MNTSSGTINQAHKIERLVFYDANGNVLTTYTSAEYNVNPNGSYQNNWPLASLLIVCGLILGGGALVYSIMVKKPQVSTNFGVGANPCQPYQQPYAQQNPYGQAYPPPQQYLPTLLYPPQPPTCGQPGSNPYQQPPEP